MIQIDINMPIGCIYEGDNGKTEYCPLCNHDDVPYCQYLDDDEAALGIDERPCYCPLYKLEPQWISCDERLPEEGTEVLGTDRNGCIRHVYKDKTGLYEFATVEEGMHIGIVAWMPLPEPRKGKWIKDRDCIYHCSCCGTDYLMYELAVKDTHYCPNCGADMRQRDDER